LVPSITGSKGGDGEEGGGKILKVAGLLNQGDTGKESRRVSEEGLKVDTVAIGRGERREGENRIGESAADYSSNSEKGKRDGAREFRTK